VYLDHQALLATVAELDARGWTTKRWTTSKGEERGGKPFNKNSLFKLLTNVLYVGRITYKEEAYDGEHPAIVDAAIFDRAQRLLKRNGCTGGKLVRNRFGALLKGLLRCTACGCGMVPTHSTRNGNKRYRYYVCYNAQSRGWHNCPSPSIPAPEIERFVVDQIRSIGKDSHLLAEIVEQSGLQKREAIEQLEAEHRTLERELQRHDGALRKLACQDGQVMARMADLQDRIRATERQATEVRERIIALERELVDAREVASVMAMFDPVWETLSPREQSRVLHLLIERVEHDGPNGKVSITFHPTGIKTLAEDLKDQEVMA
jgi:site-specific DNA recombinase